MNAPGTALQGKHTGTASELYMAVELGEKNWKLSLSDGARGPSRYTAMAGDKAAVLKCIAKVRARCGLAQEASVHSCVRPDAMASGCTAGSSSKASITSWWIPRALR